MRAVCYFIKPKFLHGESHQVGSNTEARTLARRHADGGGEDVQHREHRRRRDGHRENLVEGQGLPGDEHKRECNSDALHYILDNTGE